MSCQLYGAVNHEFYGYIKVDTSYDTDRSNHGNRAFFLLPESKAEKDDDEFTITANQTRLGVKLDAGAIEGFDVSGKVEADFYEGGAEAKPRLRLRYAFIDLQKDGLQLRAGQAPRPNFTFGDPNSQFQRWLLSWQHWFPPAANHCHPILGSA